MVFPRRVLAVVGIAVVVSTWLVTPSSGSQFPMGSSMGKLKLASRAQSPAAIARVLVLNAGDVAAGWKSDGTEGQCIASGPGSDPGAPYCGSPPLLGEEATGARFAWCVGVPLSHVSMWTGVDEPGEPFTFSSSMYTAPDGSRTNPTEEAPTALSNLTIESSVASQRSDLEAFAKPVFPSCFKIEENGAVFQFVQSYAHLAHLKLSFGQLERVAAQPAPGVSLVEYQQVLSFTGPKLRGSDTYWMVLMGAANIEEYLELGGSSADPLPAPVAERIIGRVELRLANFVAIAEK